MYATTGPVDAVVCVAVSGALDDFQSLTEQDLLDTLRGKFFGQVNLVLLGQRHLRDGGSFTLTSGVFADHPARGVTGGGVASAALHGFVLSASLELRRGLRINAVSPGLAEDSVDTFGDRFPGLSPVPMARLTGAYLESVEGDQSGQILRAYT
ncbi:SDR family oxidoreductase [Frankia sp. Ag45/Mut15]|uniref:SDR family oxidoreductase n=1 Tax=Frankia umida TaxID=573489 RepID=A0ABT0K221_9ACTN|nr:SDR family oxidoreductase [Frankia umida]MCK9877338.1 SDR family oxidoreductase [Frankia umida]